MISRLLKYCLNLFNIVCLTVLIGFMPVSYLLTPVNYQASGSTIVLTVPEDFESEYRGEWNYIERILTSPQYSTVILNWRGWGGSTNMGFSFIRSVETAERQGKTVIFRLTGGSYSMHSLVVCYAYNIQNRGQLLMFHAAENAFGGLSTGVIKTQLNKCVQRGILNNQDLYALDHGMEVWVYGGKKVYKHDRRR